MESLAAEKKILDYALASEHGITLSFPTQGKLTHVAQRLYRLRSLDREKSREVYPPDSPAYGKSPYDKLQFSKKINEEESVFKLNIQQVASIEILFDVTITDSMTGEVVSLEEEDEEETV